MSWVKGVETFDRLLIDADWALNNGNWMWLSASSFFYQYFRVYSPITFGQKYDPRGQYVRRFLPVLKARYRPCSRYPHVLVTLLPHHLSPPVLSPSL